MKFRPFLLLIIFCQVSVSVNAQQIKDTSIVFTGDEYILLKSPSNLVTYISVFAVKFSDGQKGLEFSFQTNGKSRPAWIKDTIIVLKSTKGHLYTIQNPRRDTITTYPTNYMKYFIIHNLSAEQIKMLKIEEIASIELQVENNPVEFKIKGKVRRKLMEYANNNW